LIDEILPTAEETNLAYDALNEIWKAITNQGKKLSAIRAVDMYGSTINGLAIRGNSDLDLTITVDDYYVN
jgi:tRNA nucleotidyltransferase (CCA-adding enzyme)